MELLDKAPYADDTRREMLEAVKREQSHRFAMEWIRNVLTLLNTLLAAGVFIFVMLTASELSKNPDAAPQVWRVLLSATAFSGTLVGGNAILTRRSGRSTRNPK
ncbi:hypothetical protein [Micromonospora sp. IBHARD004]|uniref:hypothetical protein n=1 Tax=Micromonospora sp. IBHARD004 TaxID=3457764 RepID=UPI004059C9A0